MTCEEEAGITHYYSYTATWTDQYSVTHTTTYFVYPGDASKPVVVLLHGLQGNHCDFITGGGDRYDFKSPLPQLKDLGWFWVPVVVPSLAPAVNNLPWPVEFDPLLPPNGWVHFLQQNGFSAVTYDQVDNTGLLATSDNPALAGPPVYQLDGVLSDLIKKGLAASGLPAKANLVFLADSRGSLLVRKYLKDHAKDPMLKGRIQRVVTLGGPHQGSLLANAGISLKNAVAVLELVVGKVPLIDDALAWVEQTLTVPAWTELAVGSAFLADLANGEQPFPGAVYHTFGGTSVTTKRLRWWWYVSGNAPSFHLPPFDYQIVCLEVPGFSPWFDCFNIPIDELTPGKGDAVVANANAHLSYSVSLSMPVSHAQWLFDSTVWQEVLSILLSPL